MQLVHNAREIPKRWSAQAAILAAVVTLQELVPIWESLLPENVFVVVGALIASASVFLQALPQRNLKP